MRSCTGPFGLIALLLAFGVSGCVGERDFPTPTKMCENLVNVCGDPVLLEHENSVFRECHAIGVAGRKDRSNEDQCFAFYEECINECDFYAYYYTLDAGPDAQAIPDAAVLDAGVEVTDAASDGDE